MPNREKRYMRESIPKELRMRTRLVKIYLGGGGLMLQNQSMNEFYQRNDISVIYVDIVNEIPQSFKGVIKDFVDITSRLSERL